MFEIFKSYFLKISQLIVNARQSASFMSTLDAIKKYSIYAAVFLTPIFFTPWVFDGIDVDKQALVVLLMSIALFSWIISTLIAGNVYIQFNKIHIVIGSVALVYLASTVFSVFIYGSFWGWPQTVSSSLISVISFCILYFLVSTAFSEKEALHSLVIFGISSLIAQAFGLLQLASFYILPFAFAKNAAFNSIGSIGGLALFSATLLPLFMVFTIIAKKWRRYVFFANTLLAFAIIIWVNYYFIWIIVLIGVFLVIAIWIARKDFFSGAWLFLPMFFLIISFFFVIFNPQLKWIPVKPLEVSLSHKATFNIAVSAIKKAPLFGSGPGSFIYDFDRYKSKDMNKGALWQIEFGAGSSKILTDVATVGILGTVVFLLAAVLPVWYGVSSLVFNNLKGGISILRPKAVGDMPQKYVATLCLSVVLVCQAVGYFLYNSNFSLLFAWFFCVGVLTALVFDHKKKYVLTSSSLVLLSVTFIFTAVLIFGIGILALGGQRYYANIHYSKALTLYGEGRKQDAVRHFSIAANNNKHSDLYFRQLAITHMSILQDSITQFNNAKAGGSDGAKIAIMISNALNAVNIAIAINPQNSANWSAKGYICQNFIGFHNDAVGCAIKSYDRAIELSGTNPAFFLQEGNTYARQISNAIEAKFQGQSIQLQSQKSSILRNAIEKYKSAIDLKPDYTEAYLQMAIVQKIDGNVSATLESLKSAESYSQNDPAMLFQIGLFYYQNKDWEASQANFTRALLLSPNYANALYYSGLVYDKQGKVAYSVAQFSKILSLNPNDKIIPKIIGNLTAGKGALEGLTSVPQQDISPPDVSKSK